MECGYCGWSKRVECDGPLAKINLAPSSHCTALIIQINTRLGQYCEWNIMNVPPTSFRIFIHFDWDDGTLIIMLQWLPARRSGQAAGNEPECCIYMKRWKWLRSLYPWIMIFTSRINYCTKVSYQQQTDWLCFTNTTLNNYYHGDVSAATEWSRQMSAGQCRWWCIITSLYPVLSVLKLVALSTSYPKLWDSNMVNYF